MTITNEIIEAQRKKVFGQPPFVHLVESCHIGNGILQHSEEEKRQFIQHFFQSGSLIQMFIPASGSGSRMFQFLFDFLEAPNDDNRGKVERFLNHINDFAFSRKMAADLLKRLETNQINLSDFAKAILDEKGLGFSNLPKGLIPFHKYGYFILNPFQEHVLQAAILNSGVSKVHFSINSDFESIIQQSLTQIKALSGYEFSTELSEQDKDSNSIAFDDDQTPVLKQDGSFLTRPAGHGALLSNLNDLDADIVFIKNIDNIRYQNQSDTSLQHIQYLSGVLSAFSKRAKELIETEIVDRNELNELLSDYQMLKENNDINNLSDEQIRKWLNRPRRVCGMVKNEGQPGGGPFWVERNGSVSKQIVEKSQIPLSQQQYNVSVKNTHFNPVMIACATKGLKGEKIDLTDFSDDSSYFIVQKQYEGKPIRFLEQPGLWNGGMADWNSIFVEIPTETFSPVKSILDLLDKAHREV